MASVEQSRNNGQNLGFAEKTGANVRNVGIVIAVLGLLPVLRELVLPGAGLAASGEIFRRATKKKK
jgi:hypothetical protein